MKSKRQLQIENKELKAAEVRRRKDDRFWNGLAAQLVTPLTPDDIIKMCEVEERFAIKLVRK